MTSVTWPESLPRLLRLDGMSGKRKPNVVRTQMDAGPSKTRQRYTTSTKEFKGSIIINEEQRKTLENWYKSVIANGALRFRMLDPQTMTEAEFRFTDDYSEDSTGDGLWNISLPLEKMNA